jgi:hypothetical protein
VRISASSDLRHTIILDGMQQPLPQEFPEYSVVKRPRGVHEFRVETKTHFLARNASASYFTGLCDWALVMIFPILAVAWQTVRMPLTCAGYSTLKPSLGSSLGSDA